MNRCREEGGDRWLDIEPPTVAGIRQWRKQFYSLFVRARFHASRTQNEHRRATKERMEARECVDQRYTPRHNQKSSEIADHYFVALNSQMVS
jgi:hypothetical protein